MPKNKSRLTISNAPTTKRVARPLKILENRTKMFSLRLPIETIDNLVKLQAILEKKSELKMAFPTILKALIGYAYKNQDMVMRALRLKVSKDED